MPKYMIDDKEVTLAELVSHLDSDGSPFVKKDRFDKQVEARKAAEAQLEDAGGAGKQLEKANRRLAELEGELATTRTQADLAKAGITDDRMQKAVRSVYAAEIDGVEKPPTLAEWLAKDGATHPMVKAALPAGRTTEQGQKPGSVTETNAGAGAGVGPRGKETPEQLRERITTALAGLDPKAARAKLSEIQAEYNHGTEAGP